MSRAGSLPGKVSVELGRYPRNERVNACTRWEAFLPEGSRLWGQVSLGARCVQGPPQSLYVASRVRIQGQVVMATRHIGTGQTIDAADLQLTDADLGGLPPDVILQPGAAAGRVTRASVSPGRPLQERHLQQELVIQAGQPVRLVFESDALSVSNEGTAINSAARGQPVRVRLPGGRVVSGTAQAEGRVSISP
ncbi:MAG: flagellar basal body P-ring formation chaperone FlgA [Candidatus Dactylopiibacterium sp.]